MQASNPSTAIAPSVLLHWLIADEVSANEHAFAQDNWEIHVPTVSA